jgi:hypothetical protein
MARYLGIFFLFAVCISSWVGLTDFTRKIFADSAWQYCNVFVLPVKYVVLETDECIHVTDLFAGHLVLKWAMEEYCHVLGLWLLDGVLDWTIGFIDTLYIQVGTTRTYSAIADLHTLQFTVTQTL